MPCSLSQFTQLLRKVPGISPEPLPSLKMLGPWENKQCSVTAWLGALGDSKMSLAVLARLNCWETGLQKHRAGLACLGTTEVWVLRRPHSASVNLSMAPQQLSAIQPGPRPGTEVIPKCPVECHSTSALPLPALSRALHTTQVPSTSPAPQCPSGQPLGCRDKGSCRRP